MGFLLSLFFGFVPAFFFAYIIYWLDRYEKEPEVLLGIVFVWGAVFAAGAAFLVNTTVGVGIYLFTNSQTASNITTTSLVAPVVEEFLKGTAVFFIFLFFRQEFDSILDGIVYAAITALGFAATENVYYIYHYGYGADGMNGLLWLAFVRVFLVGWQHPFYTAFTGIGLAVARLNRNLLVKIAAPLSGWVVAVLMHSLHNILSETIGGANGLVLGAFWDWTGWFLMLLFILWALRREQNWITSQLQEEIGLGTITSGQYRTACSAWSQGNARLTAIFSGRYQATHRFYQTCVELAFKKQQREALGEEDGNSLIISRLRAELLQLSPLVKI